MVDVKYSFNLDDPMKNAVTLHRVCRVTIQGMGVGPDGKPFFPRYRNVTFDVFNDNGIAEEWCEIGDKTVAFIIYPEDTDVYIVGNVVLIDAPKKEVIDWIPRFEEFTVNALALGEPRVNDRKTGKYLGRVFNNESEKGVVR